MSHSRGRAVKIIVFLALFVLIEWTIEWTELRPRAVTAAVDSVALATGLGSQLVEDVLVGAAAFIALQIILVLVRSLGYLTGEPRREMRMPDEMTHEHGAADE